MFEYDRNLREAKRKLDNYNLEMVIDECKALELMDLDDIRDGCVNKYGEEMEDILDKFSDLELIEYLTNKYNIHFTERVQYLMNQF